MAGSSIILSIRCLGKLASHIDSTLHASDYSVIIVIIDCLIKVAYVSGEMIDGKKVLLMPFHIKFVENRLVPCFLAYLNVSFFRGHYITLRDVAHIAVQPQLCGKLSQRFSAVLTIFMQGLVL